MTFPDIAESRGGFLLPQTRDPANWSSMEH